MGDIAHATNASNEFFIQGLPNEWHSEDELMNTLSRSRDFRLSSLKAAPRSFATTYDQEILFPQERWVQRLQNTNAKQFVALSGPVDGHMADKAYQTGEWIGGIIVSRVPQDGRLEYSSSKAIGGQKATSAVSEYNAPRYHVNALFVKPFATGQGLGRRLIQEALAWIRADTQGQGLSVAKAHIRVDTWNEAAVGLYSSCGFRREYEEDCMVGGEQRRALTMSFTSKADS